MQNNKIVLFLGVLFFGLVSAGSVLAQPVCPVCVVAVAGGLGLSRWIGVDDVITSLWIGALLMALVLWTISWLKKKNWNFKFSDIAVFLLYYLFTYIPLYYAGIIGQGNNILGMDKVLFGSILGTLIFIFALWFNNYLKVKNNGRGYFPYQKVVVPFVILLLSSLITYFII
jgi:hypothetical protein